MTPEQQHQEENKLKDIVFESRPLEDKTMPRKTVEQRPREKEPPQETQRGSAYGRTFHVTAYDLSVESCGKSPGHPAYGVTATGKNLAGHSLESARAIAVDPNVIPLGSKVQINFEDESMRQFDGIYTAVDTGGGVNGNHIDIFAGEDAGDLARQIGRRTARVQILN